MHAKHIITNKYVIYKKMFDNQDFRRYTSSANKHIHTTDHMT